MGWQASPDSEHLLLQGFPTIKLFSPGPKGQSVSDYQGERSAKGLSDAATGGRRRSLAVPPRLPVLAGRCVACAAACTEGGFVLLAASLVGLLTLPFNILSGNSFPYARLTAMNRPAACLRVGPLPTLQAC